MKPYRSIYFNDERKWVRHAPEDDILKVGILKAVGYSYYSENIATLLSKDCNKIIHHNMNILYVGDIPMMRNILDNENNRMILEESGWNFDYQSIIQNIANNHVCHTEKTKLYHLIAELFNSWCLWCEPQYPHPYWIDKNYEPLSWRGYNLVSPFKKFS